MWGHSVTKNEHDSYLSLFLKIESGTVLISLYKYPLNCYQQIHQIPTSCIWLDKQNDTAKSKHYATYGYIHSYSFTKITICAAERRGTNPVAIRSKHNLRAFSCLIQT